VWKWRGEEEGLTLRRGSRHDLSGCKFKIGDQEESGIGGREGMSFGKRDMVERIFS